MSAPKLITALLGSAIWLAGCASDGGNGTGNAPIEFEQTLTRPAQTTAFLASGKAIDDGRLCPRASGFYVGNEDGEGNELTEVASDALFSGSEPFVTVGVDAMTCDDGSGEFELRIWNEIDPSDPDFVPDGTTWTITGGAGYETLRGEGVSSLPEFRDDGMVVWTGSGNVSDDDGR
jgi:hypothetical protein